MLINYAKKLDIAGNYYKVEDSYYKFQNNCGWREVKISLLIDYRQL